MESISRAATDAARFFRGKKITLMGLGVLGRGVGDAVYLARAGAELIVTDLKPHEALAASVAQLDVFPNATLVLGEHRRQDFQGRNLIVKAAGVPLNSPYLAEARAQGTPIRMSADLFAEFAHIPIAGVTGTRGKSTVTHMLHAILTAAGKAALLGGNIRGVSTLALLPEVTPESLAVLELDSWQLQGFGEAKRSPRVAVFTTFYPDHQNYYKDAPEQYLADKANIFLYQTPEDMLVLGAQCAPAVIEQYGERMEAHTVIADELKLPGTWELKVPGRHNRYNAALALAAARALAVPDETSRAALESFEGVPGRLELLREVDGVKVYNDTTATTPEATLAALRALDTGARNLILIMGGADKELDMNTLLYELPNVTKRVILLAGTGTDRVLPFLEGASVFDDLTNAVDEAFRAAVPGDTILFSPAFASFGMFANEYDRGDQFDAIIKNL